jgi:hypothetical protein
MPEYDNPAELRGPFELSRTYVAGRSILDCKTIHYADILPILEDEYPEARAVQNRFGFRAILSVPLMRGGTAYGAILLWRRSRARFRPIRLR